MKLIADMKVNLRIPGVKKEVEEATRLGLRDTIVAIHGDTLRNAISLGIWKTGHNNRSIASEVSGMGTVEQGADAETEKVVDDSRLEAACYSTSGYGGYLETGTVKMPARPYFRPALDMHGKELPENIKRYLK